MTSFFPVSVSEPKLRTVSVLVSENFCVLFLVLGRVGLNYSPARGSGGEAPVAGRFLWFFEKIAISRHLNHISHVFRVIWKNQIDKMESYLQELSCLAPSLS